jgi:hypothetical protein
MLSNLEEDCHAAEMECFAVHHQGLGGSGGRSGAISALPRSADTAAGWPRTRTQRESEPAAAAAAVACRHAASAFGGPPATLFPQDQARDCGPPRGTMSTHLEKCRPRGWDVVHPSPWHSPVGRCAAVGKMPPWSDPVVSVLLRVPGPCHRKLNVTIL